MSQIFKGTGSKCSRSKVLKCTLTRTRDSNPVPDVRAQGTTFSANPWPLKPHSSSITADLREQFIMKSPSVKFADWCRFTDKYPVLLDDSDEATVYMNEAISAMGSKSEPRAKLCIEKAVFLTLIGGKKQTERDEFFDNFHQREPRTMETFQQRYKTIEERCRSKKSSARLPSQPTTRSGDGESVRHIQEGLGSVSLNPVAARHTVALEVNDEHPVKDPVGSESVHHQDVPIQAQPRRRGPPINTSDPANTGLEPSIKGGSDTFEKLDPRYERRDPRRAGSFFRVGRVFAILEHVEDGRRFDDRTSDAKWKTTKGDVLILSHIRRFVVVREGHGYCWAVPVNTYNGRGLLDRGLNDQDIQAHAIIHDSEDKPKMLKGEPMLSKTPIAVDRSPEADPLTYASRINFSKVTTVEHNVRAMAVGKVSQRSHANFMNYWRQHLLN